MKTSLYSILCIAIRAGAIIWAAGSLANLPFSIIAAANARNPDATMTWLLSGVGFQLMVAGLLWVHPGVLARLAAGRGSREYFESAISPAKLQYAAFSVLGAWFALRGLVFLSYELVQAAQFASDSLQARLPALADSAARIVFGVALILGARGLSGLLNAIRERGEPVQAVDNANV